MRYIKPPKMLSEAVWHIGKPFTKTGSRRWTCEYECNIPSYIDEYGHEEYIIDARVFRSALISKLLNLKYEG